MATTKTPKKRTSRKAKTAADLGVVAQIRMAFRPENLLATVIGLGLGGLIPLVVFMVSHHEIDFTNFRPSMIPLCGIVLGGLVYSAKTVFSWGSRAFHSGIKAVGFVVLTEGVMTLSSLHWLAVMALVYLMAINAIATGCTLALEKK